jgi:hypothetical protein
VIAADHVTVQCKAGCAVPSCNSKLIRLEIMKLLGPKFQRDCLAIDVMN